MRFTKQSIKHVLKPYPADSKGFTLAELLVSIAIFSMVISIAMYSFRLMFNMVRYLDAPYAEQTQKISRLQDGIAALFFYIGEKPEVFGQKKKFFNYFYGDSQEMTFITAKPSLRQGLSVCRIYLKDADVLLNESPVYALDSDYLNPVLDSAEKKEVILFKDVKSFALEYYQGEKKLLTLKEEFPSLVRIIVSTDKGDQEIFCKIRSDFLHKIDLVRTTYEPI